MTCQVCSDPQSEPHFGGLVCRACSAFFRRRVISHLEVKCTKGDNCVITNERVKLQCKSCRMKKCLMIGMKIQKVQMNRDRHDNTKAHTKFTGHLEHPLPVTCLLNLNNMKLKLIYEKFNEMLAVRKSSFPRKKVLKYPHLGQALKIFEKDVMFAFEWFRSAFPELVYISSEEQLILYRNFYLKWNIYEPGFLAALLGKTKTFYLPNGDMADEVGRYYTRHLEKPPDVSQDIVSRVFTPYWTAFQSMIVLPVMSAKLSLFEFLLLAAIFLWDSGVDGLSQSTCDLVDRFRRQMLLELTVVTRDNAKGEDHNIRLCRNMLLLNGVQRSCDTFEEELQLGSLYKIISPEGTDWYTLIKGPMVL